MHRTVLDNPRMGAAATANTTAALKPASRLPSKAFAPKPRYAPRNTLVTARRHVRHQPSCPEPATCRTWYSSRSASRMQKRCGASPDRVSGDSGACGWRLGRRAGARRGERVRNCICPMQGWRWARSARSERTGPMLVRPQGRRGLVSRGSGALAAQKWPSAAARMGRAVALPACRAAHVPSLCRRGASRR